MRESLVGFRHAVDIVLFLDRVSAPLRRVKNLVA
jgi:hypothetical protein